MKRLLILIALVLPAVALGATVKRIGERANVRSSEGAGTTTLVYTDYREQIFTLTAARTVVLPSTSIKSGERFTLVNKSTYKLSIQSSGLNDVDNITLGRVVLVATQDTPTTAAHWITTEAMSEWVGYSAQVAGLGVSYTDYPVQYWRVGGLLKMNGLCSTSTVNSNEFRIYLPTGLTVGLGSGFIGNNVKVGTLSASAVNSSDDEYVLLGKAGNSYLTVGEQSVNAGLNPRAGTIFASNYAISWEATVPIAEWVMFQ